MRLCSFPVFCLFVLAMACSAGSAAQVLVPSHAVTITFPEKRGIFTLYNRGTKPVVVDLDLAERGNVHRAKNDGLAVLYPRTARLEPGGKQKVSVTWRGDMNRSHYYLVRVVSLEENQLQQDRSVEKTSQAMHVRVGQAFPIHLEAPDTRPVIELSSDNRKALITNKGQRGDHIQALRLGNGELMNIRQFIAPGESIFAPAELSAAQITSVKLRRFGWVTVRDRK